jgi:hypothetical protein
MIGSEEVRGYLERAHWVEGLRRVRFLCAGEYNDNFVVAGRRGRYVFRANHGSRLGLKDQAGYEFRALKAVEDSGVTPKALRYDPDPEGLSGGVLLMEYLPGRFLDYGADRRRAARVFARIHALPRLEGLLVRSNPVRDLADESYTLIRRFPDHPLERQKRMLLRQHERVLDLGEKTLDLLQEEPPCIVNTEDGSRDFLVRESADEAFLVDWEKAVVSCRYQDLAHFVAPTTTLWQSDYVYSREEKLEFLQEYRECLGLEEDLKGLFEKTRILERALLLRAISWCYMAYYAFSRGLSRPADPAAFEKIKSYLVDMSCFLN